MEGGSCKLFLAGPCQVLLVHINFARLMHACLRSLCTKQLQKGNRISPIVTRVFVPLGPEVKGRSSTNASMHIKQDSSSLACEHQSCNHPLFVCIYVSRHSPS